MFFISLCLNVANETIINTAKYTVHTIIEIGNVIPFIVDCFPYKNMVQSQFNVSK